jgi:magnesium transporter
MCESNDLDIILESGNDQELRSFLNLLQRDELLELLQQSDPRLWQRILGFLHPSELAALFIILNNEQRNAIVERLNGEQLSALLSELESPELRQLLGQIQQQRWPDLLLDMESDDAADILGELPNELAQQVLAQMPLEDAAPLQHLLQYPEDTAGGLMQTELIRVYVNNTVQQAIEEIRRQAEQKKGDLDIYELYVVNEQEQLVGHFSLENLVLSDPQTPVVDLIETDLFWVPVTLDQEEVADYFQRYNLVSLPVLDSDRKLLGRITVDDIVDVIEEEASEDIFQMAGVGGDDVAYDRIMRSAALRLPWLITNLFGGLLTGYLIWIFQVPLGEKLLVLLVAFVPVITGMGGNVGTQSASITVRGFALGRIELQNFSRYLIKEMRVGALMGLICGLTLSLIGWLWYGNAYRFINGSFAPSFFSKNQYRSRSRIGSICDHTQRCIRYYYLFYHSHLISLLAILKLSPSQKLNAN